MSAETDVEKWERTAPFPAEDKARIFATEYEPANSLMYALVRRFFAIRGLGSDADFVRLHKAKDPSLRRPFVLCRLMAYEDSLKKRIADVRSRA